METVSAIGSLWPVLLIILIGCFIIYFRKEIKLLLREGYLKIKRGNTEVEVKGSHKNERISGKKTEEPVTQDDESNDINKIGDEILEETEWVDKFFNAYIKKDKDLLKDLYKNMENEAPDNIEKLKNKALYYFFLFRLGESKGLDKLNELRKRNDYPKAEEYILRHIGYCHKDRNRLRRASQLFEKAAESANTEERKARDMGLSAECIFNRKPDEAYIKLMKLIKEENNGNVLYIYYKKLAKLYNINKKNKLSAFSLEKAIEFKAKNSDLFNAAYRYKDYFGDLILLHYKKLTGSDPYYKNGLNNLGVVYGNLNLLGKQIKSYKRAIKNNENTLSSANLANNFIDGGFYEEAEKVIKEARQKEEVHKNIGDSLGLLQNRRSEEKEQEEEFLDNALRKQRFLRKYTSKYFSLEESTIIFEGKWKFKNDTEIEIEQKNGNLIGLWKKGGTNYKIKGKISNRACEVEKYKEKFSLSYSKINFKKTNELGYLYLSNEKSEMFTMFINREDVRDFTFNKLTKV